MNCECYDPSAVCPVHGPRCAACGELLSDGYACCVTGAPHKQRASRAALLSRLAYLVLVRGTQVCPHDQGILLFAPHGACGMCGLDGREVERAKQRNSVSHSIEEVYARGVRAVTTINAQTIVYEVFQGERLLWHRKASVVFSSIEERQYIARAQDDYAGRAAGAER